MNKLSVIALTLLMISTACKTGITSNINAAKTIADEVNTVDDAVEANDFRFLDASLEGKDIIILGEADHGDGKTFEVKSQLVKYLIEQKGYNTIAFEQRDFFEIEYINGRKSLEGVLDESLKHNWARNWNPWGPAKEIQTLVDVLETHKLGYVGLEFYNYTSLVHTITYLRKQVGILGIEGLEEETWDELLKIHSQIARSYDNTVTAQQADFYITNVERLMANIDPNKNTEFSFIYQMAENAVTLLKYRQLFETISEEEYYKVVNLRDIQLAKNFMWYKKWNPDAKIIVWMANFHGARSLRDVKFADGDPATYTKLTVFGEHIANKYPDKVYSIAFTSSRGTSKMPYNHPGNEESVINAPQGSFESYLDTKNINFGFVEFSAIRKNNRRLINSEFSSIMLGYTNQTGKWLNVFDGVFYIRENHNATPIK